MSEANIIIPLKEAINSFDCVKGVYYEDNENKNVVLIPHFTRAYCQIVDCTILDRETLEGNGNFYPYNVDRLGEPLPDKNQPLLH